MSANRFSKQSLRSVVLGAAAVSASIGFYEIQAHNIRNYQGAFNKAAACELRQKIFENAACSSEELANIKERDASADKTLLGGGLMFAGLGLSFGAMKIKP